MVEDKDTDLLEKEVEVYENVEKKPSKNVKLIKEVASQEENRAGKHNIYKKESFKAIPKGQNGEFTNNDDPQFHDTTDFLKNVKETTGINKKRSPLRSAFWLCTRQTDEKEKLTLHWGI